MAVIKWPRRERKDGLRPVVMYPYLHTLLDWFWSSLLKSLPANAGDIRDTGSLPGLRRFPGAGYHNPLQYSCLKNPMDRGAWRATFDRVIKSWTLLKQLSTLMILAYMSIIKISLSSVQFSCSVVSDSLRPHELQHARPPCLSSTPGVYPNPYPLNWRCHPTISSSVVSFSSCPQSFPESRSFQMSQLFASGGQSIGASASTSVLPMNTQDWSPMNLLTSA